MDAAEQGWETLGALDLGGSSLEVTFMPLGRPRPRQRVRCSLKVAGDPIPVCRQC